MPARTQPTGMHHTPHIQPARAPATGTQTPGRRGVLGRILRVALASVAWLVITIVVLVAALLLFVSFRWGPIPWTITLLFAAGWLGLLVLLVLGVRRFHSGSIVMTATVGVLGLSLATVVVSQRSAYTPPIVDAQGKAVPGSIAILEQVPINGTMQWISIRGTRTDRPVLLWLAGGPGGSQVSTVRWHLGALEDHFVVVNWEQPGSGKSYGVVNHADLTPERYIADGIQLVRYLRQRFGEEQVYLVGESWGSALGVWMVQRNPELFQAFVGTGQMVDFIETEVADYQFALRLAQERGTVDKVTQLRAQGPPPYTGNGVIWKQAKYLLDGFAYMNADPKINDDGFNTLQDLLSPEYGFYDKVNWARGVINAGNVMFPQLWQADVDFRQDAPVLQVPVYFLIGRHDVNAPPALTEAYYAQLEAPHKALIWFERSGHNPWVTESDRFAEVLANRVLQERHSTR